MTMFPFSLGRMLGAIILAFMASAGLVCSAQAQSAVEPPGAGTAEDPYRISQLGHLVWMGEHVDVSAGKTYALQNDIDATVTTNWNAGVGMLPIGSEFVPFGGVFAGKGNRINGLFMADPERSGVALFGAVGSGGEVNNLKLTGARMLGLAKVGILAGMNEGAVFGCRAEGQVTGGYLVGGLIGHNYGGMVNHCAVMGTVTGTNYVGVLVGYDESGTIYGCTAAGSVFGHTDVGGLVGLLYKNNTMAQCSSSCDVVGGDHVGSLVGRVNWGNTLLRNCRASGDVTGGYYVGGLVGLVELEAYNACVIEGCQASGDVTADLDGAGGLVGNILDINSVCLVSRCLATGNVSGRDAVGGLAGYSSGRLTNCYATGSATGGKQVGGLVGRHAGFVTRCYAVGAVTALSDLPAVGGLVGENHGVVEASYWDMTTSGQAGSDGGTGAGTAAMMQQATFDGWDFTDVWLIAENASYPALVSRIIGVSGNLAFGPVVTGQTATAVMTITNSGNATLSVSGIGYPPGFSGDWSGSLEAGEATNVTVTFSPLAVVSYNGTVFVNADMTAGLDSLEVSGMGVPVPQPGQLCFSAAAYTAQEGVKRKIVIRRINGSDGTVSVTYVTKAKSALANKDYKAMTGTLTWTNGQSTTKSIKIPVLADGAKEGNESFQVILKNPVGATLGAPSKTTVTISGNSKDVDLSGLDF